MLEIEYDITRDAFLTQVAGEVLEIATPRTKAARDALSAMAADRWSKRIRAATRQVDMVSGDA